MKRKNIFIAAVLSLILILSGCSEVTPPEFNNPADPLSSDYKVPVPLNLTVSFRGATSVLLQWNDTWDYESGYNVERSTNGGSFENIAKPAKGTKTYLDSGLDPKKSYSYRVNRFSDNAVSEYSRTAELKPGLVSYLNVITTDGGTAAAFSHDAAILATSFSYGTKNENSEIRFWNAPFESYGSNIQGAYKNLKALAFSPNDQMLAGGTEDSTVYVWDVKTKALLKTVKEISGEVNALEFSPDGNFLAVASNNRNVFIIDTKSWTVTHTLIQHTNFVNSISFSRDGSLLASGSADGTIAVWSTSGWTVSRLINTGENKVKSVAFRPDGQVIGAAAGMSYNQYEPASGSKLKSVQTGGQEALSVAFSSDGKTFAGCCGTAINIYDTDLQPYELNFGGRSTKMFAYNTVIASSGDAGFLSLGYPTCLWAPGSWTVNYK